MKKLRSKNRKIFSCLALFVAVVGIGGSSQAASRKLYFALANNYNTQCDPYYQPINQGFGAPANYNNYGKTVKTKPLSKISDHDLPSFGVDSTSYTSAPNLQEINCNGYINQNYQGTLNAQFYEISEWRYQSTQDSQISSPIVKETHSSESESVSEIPVPGAIWLLGPALAGMYGLGKRKSIKA